MQRNYIFDKIKAILVFLVIVSHFLLGSLQENSLRNFIYIFHMPIFLGITGYFLSQKTLEIPVIKLIKKYFFRLIIPFVIASLFYYYLGFSDFYFIHRILYPYFHLWYIPAIILFIFYTKIIYKIPQNIFYVPLGIFLILTWFFESYSQWDFGNNKLYYLGDKRYYYFYSYFFMGFFMSYKKWSFNNIYLWISTILGFIIYYNIGIPLIKGLGKLILNYSLIILIISYATKTSKTYNKPNILSRIGEITLPIYLWHPLMIKSIFLNKNFLYEPYWESIYYFLCILANIFLVLFFLFINGKNKILDVIFFGKK